MWKKFLKYIDVRLARLQLNWLIAKGSVADRVTLMACFYISARDDHNYPEKELAELEARAMNFIGTYGERSHIELWNYILSDTTTNWKKS